MDFKVYLEKLRSLPDGQKKIVLWTIVAVLGLAMGYFWIRGVMNSLSKIGQQVGQIQLPEVNNEDMPKIPSLDILTTTTPSNNEAVK